MRVPRHLLLFHRGARATSSSAPSLLAFPAGRRQRSQEMRTKGGGDAFSGVGTVGTARAAHLMTHAGAKRFLHPSCFLLAAAEGKTRRAARKALGDAITLSAIPTRWLSALAVAAARACLPVSSLYAFIRRRRRLYLSFFVYTCGRARASARCGNAGRFVERYRQ